MGWKQSLVFWARILYLWTVRRVEQIYKHNSPRDILRSYFGYDSFLEHQEEIIRHLTAGKDALVLMPTGGGKSICYQIPAMLQSGTGVVISPLIALMQDQVDALRQLNIRAGFIGLFWWRTSQGLWKLWYMSWWNRNLGWNHCRPKSPFIVFHDRTLRELVAYLPRSLEEMRGISGIGEHKLELYGETFLDLILDHVQENT